MTALTATPQAVFTTVIRKKQIANKDMHSVAHYLVRIIIEYAKCGITLPCRVFKNDNFTDEDRSSFMKFCKEIKTYPITQDVANRFYNILTSDNIIYM